MTFLATLVDLSRWQFAMTAMYHWLFVPLTLGLGFLIAFMETRYVMTGDEFWKRTTKFWMKLFAVNFAMGVATGIILEFEFGTNWSNYSWFVGDIFGAPLAIEGIFAFFMESTFFAVMYFGWNKVSKKAHLVSTWLTAIGTNLSAVWILIANAWMQYPIGMEFNPDTARSEMTDFWAVVSSPVAINKFLHSVTNGYVLASVFVIAVSSWFLLRKRETLLARKSIRVASVFGIISLAVLIGTGDGSAYNVAKVQPMKLAAMEGLYDGSEKAPLVAVGILNPDKDIIGEDGADEDPYLFDISFPNMLSFLATRQADGFVPGINDIIEGGYEFTDREGNIYIEPSFAEKKAMGTAAVSALAGYQAAKEAGDTLLFRLSLYRGAGGPGAQCPAGLLRFPPHGGPRHVLHPALCSLHHLRVEESYRQRQAQVAPVAGHHQRAPGLHLLSIGLDSSGGRPSALDHTESAAGECGGFRSRAWQCPYDPYHLRCPLHGHALRGDQHHAQTD